MVDSFQILTFDLPMKTPREGAVRSSRESLATEAYQIVRDRILRGELPIGNVISRRKLAAELGMSLLPVSEAFQRLEFEGLLESRPRAGTRVRIPNEQDVRGHYILRQALEAEAARMFAEVATAGERLELQKLAARVDTLSQQTDGNQFQYLSLHEKLHRRIAECTRCQPLVDAIEKNHVLALTWLCVARSPAIGRPRRGHRDLIDILIKGEPVVAAEAMRAHINSALENTLQRLEPYFKLRETNGTTYARGMSANSVPTPVEMLARTEG
jgi:DNA-binding GntR family transcriptional regulator